MFHGHCIVCLKTPLGGRPSTKLGDHGTQNAYNHLFYAIYHVWRPVWIEIHWNSIWLRAPSHMASNYTWGYVTTLHDFGGMMGWPYDTSFWAITISWSRLLHREVIPLSSRTPRARRKKSTFSKLHHKIGSKFYEFFSWVDIHNNYYTLEIHNQIWWSVFSIKHTVSN